MNIQRTSRAVRGGAPAIRSASAAHAGNAHWCGTSARLLKAGPEGGRGLAAVARARRARGLQGRCGRTAYQVVGANPASNGRGKAAPPTRGSAPDLSRKWGSGSSRGQMCHASNNRSKSVFTYNNNNNNELPAYTQCRDRHKAGAPPIDASLRYLSVPNPLKL